MTTTENAQTVPKEPSPEILRNEIEWLRDQLDAKPRNVIAALAAVMADMPGIGKDSTSGEGGGPNYKYRSIEAITAAAQSRFGRFGIVFVPKVIERVTKDLTVNNKPWTEEQLTVEYTVYGPGGVNDHITVGPVIGLGRDNSDKQMTKALTQCFKQALLQVLCIGDGKDDADAQTHETDAPAPRHVQPSASAVLAERVRSMPDAVREVFPAWLDANQIPRKPADWSETHMAAVERWVDHFDSTGELPLMDATGAPNPSEGTDGPPEAPEAPESTPATVREASEAQADAQVADQAGPEAVDAEVERVKGMKAGEVRQALEAMGKPVDGSVDQLRKRLTIALLRERIAAKTVTE